MHSQSLLLGFAAIIHLTSSTITTPPRPLAPRQTASASASGFDANIAACSSYSSLESSCSAATTSFGALPFSSEASCLCYTDVSTYMPSIFDGYLSSCLDYYQTASPAYYSQSLSGDTLTRTPCAAAGNVMGSAAATGVVSSVVASGATATSAATTTSGSGTASSTASGTSDAVASAERGSVFFVLAGLATLFALS